MTGLCPTAERLIRTWTDDERQAFCRGLMAVHGHEKADREWKARLQRERYIPPETREQILERDCLYCGGAASVVDHYIPVSRGGLRVRANLVPACYTCNQDKADLFVDEWQASRERLGRSWPPPNTEEIRRRLLDPVRRRLRAAIGDGRISASPPDVGLMEILQKHVRRVYNGENAWAAAEAAMSAYLDGLVQQADVDVH